MFQLSGFYYRLFGLKVGLRVKDSGFRPVAAWILDALHREHTLNSQEAP